MFYATSFSLLFFANSVGFAQQGDLDIGSSDPLQESLDQSVGEMSNIYVVQPGDTLWSFLLRYSEIQNLGLNYGLSTII